MMPRLPWVEAQKWLQALECTEILSQLIKSRTCGVHGALRRLLDVLEELRLGGARVTQQQHVDVATQPVGPAWRLLLQTSHRTIVMSA